VHLPGGLHTAEAVRDAPVSAMAEVPVPLRRSLTWDQGRELALHAEISPALGMPVSFCDPATWPGPRSYSATTAIGSSPATLRLAAEAIACGDTPLAATLLDQAQPESPDGSAPTVAACTGIALGVLDQWLAGHDTDAPAGLAARTRLPAGHWTGERAATDILTLARKGRAFASLDSLIDRQGGQHVLYGSALALAAALQAWAAQTDTPVSALARAAVR